MYCAKDLKNPFFSFLKKKKDEIRFICLISPQKEFTLLERLPDY
jgi:hypothetical protein